MPECLPARHTHSTSEDGKIAALAAPEPHIAPTPGVTFQAEVRAGRLGRRKQYGQPLGELGGGDRLLEKQEPLFF